MRVYDIIEAKKRRRELTDAEIGFFVKKVADGSATESAFISIRKRPFRRAPISRRRKFNDPLLPESFSRWRR